MNQLEEKKKMHLNRKTKREMLQEYFKVATNEKIKVSIIDDDEFDKLEIKNRPENKKFRVDSKTFFLTFPQCNFPPMTIFKYFENKFKGEIEKAIFCREDHKNTEGKHIHGLIEFKKNKNIKNPNFFDVFLNRKNYHASIKSTKNFIGCVLYIGGYTKKKMYDEKELFEYNISAYEIFKKVQKKNEKSIKKSEWDKLYIYGVIDIEKWANCKNDWLNYQRIKKIKIEFEVDKKKKNLNYQNIKNWEFYFKGKKRHFWIYGDSNACKTYLMNNFINRIGKEYFYEIPQSKEDFFSYEGEPFLYMNQYKGAYSINYLNKLCEGNCQVNVKRSSTIISKQTCLIIVSNFSPFSCYNKIEKKHIMIIWNRFKVFEMKEYNKPELKLLSEFLDDDELRKIGNIDEKHLTKKEEEDIMKKIFFPGKDNLATNAFENMKKFSDK